jgi:murein DD-endopeptidase MepM/ murein hydrolase activator NlpD
LKPAFVRFGLYALAALALAGALRFTPKLPDPEAKAADVLAVTQAGEPAWKVRVDTLGRGETLQAVFRRGGLTDDDVSNAMHAATATALDPRRIPAGMPVTLKSEPTDSTPSEITLQLAVDKVLKLHRDSTGWVGTEETLPWSTDTIVVGGTITSNLYDAINTSAKGALPASARQQLAWAMADVYDYRVDMSRDLQRGDEFKVVAERSTAPSGAVKIGNVIAATFKLSGNTISAVHFNSASVSGGFFDQAGRSMRAAFLRAPLEFRRISSVFGSREHPVLGGVRMHKGTDYAANYGTPVRAIGDGTVIRAGWSSGGYGNVLEIRHPNGFITRYGHLSGYTKGIHTGSHVTIGEVVARVGSTGLSTGPHLHFEVIVNGKQRDPRVALKSQGGDPVPARERSAFDSLRDRLLGTLDTVHLGVTKLAIR